MLITNIFIELSKIKNHAARASLLRFCENTGDKVPSAMSTLFYVPFVEEFMTFLITDCNLMPSKYALFNIIRNCWYVVNKVDGEPLLNDLHNIAIKRNFLPISTKIFFIATCVLSNARFKFCNIKM